MAMVKISAVRMGSIAAKKGILAKDILISINGHEIRDVLDYRFYMTETSLELLLHRGPELVTVKLRKKEYDDLGLEFDSFLMDEQHACRNKCVFCFVDQMPKGMRESLYFHDDDSRMSFLMGSYVTLTNLSDADVDRIIEMHMSPIHISVHTTDPDLRVKMMKNKNAGKVLSYMRRFADAGISMECQIVLCKGLNDGEALIRTVRDLMAYLPTLGTCSIVPCGLTCHRDGLYPLEPLTDDDCREVLDMIAPIQAECIEKFGYPVFYCSDEFYLNAGRELPTGDFYGDYAQLDNGVGMITSMKEEFDEALEELDEADCAVTREISIATGYAAYEHISSLAARLASKVKGLKIHVYRIKNDFFGDRITVAGLVTGRDLTAQLKGKALGETLYIPSVMLRHEGDRFLDDMTLSEAEQILGVSICVPEEACSGYAFVDTLLERL